MGRKAMRHILAALGFTAVVLGGGGASAAQQTVTLAVDNMYCEACPYIVKQSLARVAGVESVVVSFEQKTATVTYDDRKATPDALTSATTQAGYPSKVVP
jgi:periplasmic mercuric ion binding protein